MIHTGGRAKGSHRHAERKRSRELIGVIGYLKTHHQQKCAASNPDKHPMVKLPVFPL
jgi:hypothetical protein